MVNRIPSSLYFMCITRTLDFGPARACRAF